MSLYSSHLTTRYCCLAIPTSVETNANRKANTCKLVKACSVLETQRLLQPARQRNIQSRKTHAFQWPNLLARKRQHATCPTLRKVKARKEARRTYNQIVTQVAANMWGASYESDLLRAQTDNAMDEAILQANVDYSKDCFVQSATTQQEQHEVPLPSTPHRGPHPLFADEVPRLEKCLVHDALPPKLGEEVHHIHADWRTNHR